MEINDKKIRLIELLVEYEFDFDEYELIYCLIHSILYGEYVLLEEKIKEFLRDRYLGEVL